ncbi:unnamed protein product [Staurois parvus]|uniref:Uncharacterized protein n=1 Tax=Staurois parvus TaxID=386267 RepID=A0ABN9APM8_9NEOB|nr:unnamed protein product [Staurois parvus]
MACSWWKRQKSSQTSRVNNNRTKQYRTADENHRSQAGFSNRGSDQRRIQRIVKSQAESEYQESHENQNRVIVTQRHKTQVQRACAGHRLICHQPHPSGRWTSET